MKCSKCGKCCKLFLIDLNDEEYRSRKYKTIFDEYYEDFNEAIENAANIIAQNEDKSCVYLKDNICTIHDWRPKACRAFFCDSKAEKDQKKVGIIKRYKDSKKDKFSKNNLTFER